VRRTKETDHFFTPRDFFDLGPVEQKEPVLLSDEDLLKKMDLFFPPVN